MSGGESANDTGGVKEMEATHDTRTTEKGHDLDVALSRSNAELARLLPHPAADANKYTRGHLSLVAGSAAYPGAACLAAAAGERAGAGYTEVFCAGKSMITVRGWRPSLVVRDWRAWKPAKAPAPRPGHPTACVIGCGFDAAETSLTSLLMETVRGWEAPLLIDGGALALLANATGLRLARERAAAGRATLLTPHGGEAARLAQGAREALEEAEVAATRGTRGPLEGVADALSAAGRATLAEAALARALAEAYGAVVALKGPVTFIASPDGTAEVMDRGTSALAKAGTGDVLAGMIGALLAQGLDPRDAAALGCALHAEAGRAAAAAFTDICASAEDLVTFLPEAIRAIAP